ncbi:hypothetical protein CN210_34090 [Sinorhizobium meliloti]|nr:hypothetical protein CN210_34090 [Sinorhizobium meliloti]RVK63188.1 hypothetical protein CN154_34540 [Sinorhizobium meliloti]
MVFLGSNLLKVTTGLRAHPIAGTLITIMWTWLKSVSLLREKTARQDIPLSRFTAMVERKSEHAPVRPRSTRPAQADCRPRD